MTSVCSSMRPSRLSASCDGLAAISARTSSSISRWRRYEAKNAIWSVPAISTRSAAAIASIAPSTSERLTRRAVSSTLTWSAATACSNGDWSRLNSGGVSAGALVTRWWWRYSSRAASCSSGNPSKPSAWLKRTTVDEDVLARRASSSAVWKATSSRWSTTYWATSFWERENSSKRAEMYAESVWWPRAAGGMVAVLGIADRSFDGRSLTSSQSMRRLETQLDGLVLLEPAVHGDARGFFVETFRADVAAEHGIPLDYVQDNHSRSRRGTLRGIHFQTHPGQAKLVRVARGSVWDVVVDLRRGSPTFGEWEGITLDDETGRVLYIPVGFGHGFLVMSEVADFVYKCTAYYDPATEAGIRFDDPAVGIEWPSDVELLYSERDRTAPTLAAVADSLPF